MTRTPYVVTMVSAGMTSVTFHLREQDAMRIAYTLAALVADNKADVFLTVVYEIEGTHTLLYTYPPAPVERLA